MYVYRIVLYLVRRVGHISVRWFRAEHHTGVVATKWDDFLRVHKPYLDPLFSLDKAADLLGTNRTYVSRYVSRTYGVSLPRLMNRLRMEELERLTADPCNAGADLKELVLRAGFRSMSAYYRHRDTELRGVSRSPGTSRRGRPRLKKGRGSRARQAARWFAPKPRRAGAWT